MYTTHFSVQRDNPSPNAIFIRVLLSIWVWMCLNVRDKLLFNAQNHEYTRINTNGYSTSMKADSSSYQSTV
jgi:hypothetical protein